MIEASICTIGDEILIGQIVDTNSAFIASQLNLSGVKVSSILSIGDNLDEIISKLSDLLSRYSVVIVTGGLGPTKDDITKKALAALTNSTSFIESREQYAIIEKIFYNRGMEVTQLNREQALVPNNCKVIPNYKGTAPGMYYSPSADKLLFSLPGVPYEMEALLPSVMEIIRSRSKLEKIFHHTICTYGVPESILAQRLSDWEDNLPKEIKLAYLPNPSTGIKLRFSVYGGDENYVRELINKEIELLNKLLSSDIIYGQERDTLESVLNRVIAESKLTLSVAESCTGGRIASRIVSLPGASNIFRGGVVVYSNQSKIDILNVDKDIIEQYGAVSKECACDMAKKCASLFNTDIAIATTGIAGPDGGSEEKPVGTLWIGIYLKGETKCFTTKLSGDRERNITRFSSEALNRLRIELISHKQA